MTDNPITDFAGPQAPILTVTLNPALDFASAVDDMQPDIKLRCDAPEIDPGGGGINVSRAIAHMRGASTALVALGGTTGQRLADLLGKADLPLLPITAPGETRQSLAITDRAGGGQQYRFVMPGPEWRPRHVGETLDRIAAEAQAGGLVVLSGSNPPGVPDDFAAALAARLTGHAGLIVDTSGAALTAVAAGGYGVALLRMDAHEAEGLAGQPLVERADSAAFAKTLVARGAAKAVIVARGSDGNIIADANGAWHAEAAPVKVVSKVGAGDSFVAGYTLAIARGMDQPDALGLGAACASATCMTPATELCRPDDIAALYAARVVTPL